MISFNNIVKMAYKSDQEEIVSLSEYILFEDERANTKFIVFKFQNNLNQILNKFKFEVSQFDGDNNLIEKTTLEYEKFEASANDTFVPSAKMQANSDCKSIKVKLLYARFERVEWQDNEFKPLRYSIQSFRSDFSGVNTPTEEDLYIKLSKRLDKQYAKAKMSTKRDRRKIKIKNITHRNITKIPRAVTVILSVLAFAFIVISAFYHLNNTDQFYVDGFEYTVLSDNELSISDYDGSDKDIVIPANYKDYKIVEIDDSAFEDSDITSIEFNAAIKIDNFAFKDCGSLSNIYKAELVTEIGDYAFENCSSLTTAEFETAVKVGRGAFRNCSNIESANMPSATLNTHVFQNAKKLGSIICKDTVSSFYTVFGDVNNIVKGCTDIEVGKQSFPANYFAHMEHVENVEFIYEKPNFEYSALEGLGLDDYEINETMEVYNGKIIAIKDGAYATRLIISDKIIDLKTELEKIKSIATNITTLKIEYDNDTITSDILGYFPNLNVLEYDSNIPYTSNAFLNNYYLKTLVVNTDEFEDFNSNFYSINKLIITGNSEISSNMFNRYNNYLHYAGIESLEIEDTVTGIDNYALSNFTELSYLKMPNYSGITLSGIGVSNSLENLELTTTTNIYLNSNYINGYQNLYNITLPTNVTNVGNQFISNSGISNIILPSSVKTIEGNLANDCNYLTKIELNNGLETIGDNFIVNCEYISSISIPSTVTKIGSSFINGCYRVAYLNVPSTVKKVGLPFIENSNLTELVVPFIGSTASNTTSLSRFMDNPQKLNKLVVTGDISINSQTLASAGGLKTLVLAGATTFESSAVLKNNTLISNLEIKLKDNKYKLAELFGSSTVKLDSLSISAHDLGASFFEDCTITYLALKEINVVYNDQFDNATKITCLFITSRNQSNSLDFSELREQLMDTNFYFTDGDVSKAEQYFTTYGTTYEVFKNTYMYALNY